MRRNWVWGMRALVACQLVAMAALAFLAYLNVDNPFYVVASGSMEPTLRVGDLIVIEGVGGVKEGDVIAFRRGGEVLVHRVVGVSASEYGEPVYRTKGDNNPDDDPFAVPAREVMGRVWTTIPQVGRVTLIMRSPIALFVIAIAGFIYVAVGLAGRREADGPSRVRAKRAPEEWAESARRVEGRLMETLFHRDKDVDELKAQLRSIASELTEIRRNMARADATYEDNRPQVGRRRRPS